MSFTKGPWTRWVGHSEVVAGNVVENTDVSISGKGMFKVCEVDELDYEDAEADGKDVGDPQATADLISASPQLYDACTDLLAIVADAIMHGMPVTKKVAKARNDAASALAKADGQVPLEVRRKAAKAKK